MRFQANAKFTQGEVDVDPVAAPEDILDDHVLRFKDDVHETKSALFLCLLGDGSEDATLDLYLLVEEKPALQQDAAALKVPTTRWIAFATGIVVPNGSLVLVDADLPPGGTVYARRTADSIGEGEARRLVACWAA